jgi:hypothetical protein
VEFVSCILNPSSCETPKNAIKKIKEGNKIRMQMQIQIQMGHMHVAFTVFWGVELPLLSEATN